jgi:hypothetical protein
MRARQLIGGSAFPPHELKAIFEAFDDAWAELSPEVGSKLSSIDLARMSLATIILSIAAVGSMDRLKLKTAAMDAFRLKHGVPPPRG